MGRGEGEKKNEKWHEDVGLDKIILRKYIHKTISNKHKSYRVRILIKYAL